MHTAMAGFVGLYVPGCHSSLSVPHDRGSPLTVSNHLDATVAILTAIFREFK